MVPNSGCNKPASRDPLLSQTISLSLFNCLIDEHARTFSFFLFSIILLSVQQLLAPSLPKVLVSKLNFSIQSNKWPVCCSESVIFFCDVCSVIVAQSSSSLWNSNSKRSEGNLQTLENVALAPHHAEVNIELRYWNGDSTSRQLTRTHLACARCAHMQNACKVHKTVALEFVL